MRKPKGKEKKEEVMGQKLQLKEKKKREVKSCGWWVP